MPHRLLDVMNYNENKIKAGVAKCIQASGYLLDPEQMNFYQKLHGIEFRNQLNSRATTKTIHISLNFHPSEKLSTEELKNIADAYMERLGFQQQPYLVYRHQDAAHPHLHIVASTIRPDGSRINTHNIGRNQSELARKAVEQQFSLVKANKQDIKEHHPINMQKLALRSPEAKTKDESYKIVYGKSEMRKGIGNIVTNVIAQYNFTSLPQFNAILRQLNVVADRGEENSNIYQKGGLLFRILDEQGKKVGVPIKASILPGKPILKKLEKRMKHNIKRRENLKAAVSMTIRTALGESPVNWQQYQIALHAKNISLVIRYGKCDQVFGLTYVDHTSRIVFNGSELGKEFSAKCIWQTLSANQRAKQQTGNHFAKNFHPNQQPQIIPGKTEVPSHFTDMLIGQQQVGYVPYQLRKKTKKKKKQNP